MQVRETDMCIDEKGFHGWFREIQRFPSKEAFLSGQGMEEVNLLDLLKGDLFTMRDTEAQIRQYGDARENGLDLYCAEEDAYTDTAGLPCVQVTTVLDRVQSRQLAPLLIRGCPPAWRTPNGELAVGPVLRAKDLRDGDRFLVVDPLQERRHPNPLTPVWMWEGAPPEEDATDIWALRTQAVPVRQ